MRELCVGRRAHAGLWAWHVAETNWEGGATGLTLCEGPWPGQVLGERAQGGRVAKHLEMSVAQTGKWCRGGGGAAAQNPGASLVSPATRHALIEAQHVKCLLHEGPCWVSGWLDHLCLLLRSLGPWPGGC